VTSRRIFLVTFAGGILAVPLAAEAQQAGRLPTIGYVSPAVAGPNALVDAFNRGLREAGFVEGRNIVVDRRYMGGREDQYDQVMAQLEQQKVDVIVAAGPPAALAAKRIVKTVPVVFAGVGDPVVIGLVQSLARPGGNLTGVAFDVTPEIAGKRLELLNAAVPTLSRVAALWRRLTLSAYRSSDTWSRRRSGFGSKSYLMTSVGQRALILCLRES
jgi:putative tryptophan/tyrosine transport system substrate-binding protein